MNSTDRGGLHLNRRKAIFGGVCAGIADYFNIDRLVVRVIAIVAALVWWYTLVPFIVYIVLYFVLSDQKQSLSEMGNRVSNSKIGRHFRNVDYRKRIYKDRRNKKISGVCGGIANYLEVSPFIVRIVALGSIFFGPFGVIAYIVAAIIMDNDPEDDAYFISRRERRRQRRYQRRHGYKEDEMGDYEPRSQRETSRPFDKRDIEDCTEKFGDLERKLERLEATITSKKFKLHSEFKRMAT